MALGDAGRSYASNCKPPTAAAYAGSPKPKRPRLSSLAWATGTTRAKFGSKIRLRQAYGHRARGPEILIVHLPFAITIRFVKVFGSEVAHEPREDDRTGRNSRDL